MFRYFNTLCNFLSSNATFFHVCSFRYGLKVHEVCHHFFFKIFLKTISSLITLFFFDEYSLNRNALLTNYTQSCTKRQNFQVVAMLTAYVAITRRDFMMIIFWSFLFLFISSRMILKSQYYGRPYRWLPSKK